MSTEHKQGFCKKCDQLRPVQRKGPNHILHLILSLVTAGIWVVVWILAALMKEKWRCESCGGTKIKSVR